MVKNGTCQVLNIYRFHYIEFNQKYFGNVCLDLNYLLAKLHFDTSKYSK